MARPVWLRLGAAPVRLPAKDASTEVRAWIPTDFQLAERRVIVRQPALEMLVHQNEPFRELSIELPKGVAERIVNFVYLCFALKHRGYTPTGFMQYVTGVAPSPFLRSNRQSTVVPPAHARQSLRDGAPYRLGDGRSVNWPFIGLPGFDRHYTLSVCGNNGWFILASVEALKSLHGLKPDTAVCHLRFDS